MGYKSAVGIYVLQDQAEINEWDAYGAGYDNEGVGPNKGTTRDISMYLTGHQVDPVWHANPLIASTLGVYAGWGEGNIISPDGKYIVMEEQSTTIGYPDVGNTITYQEYPILILAKVVRNGSSVTYQSITYLPTEGAEWSTDSRYVLMGNEIYDVQQNDGSYVKIASNGDDGYEHPVGDTIAFMNSAKNVVTTGTFVYANFGKVNQSIEFRKSDGSEIDALTQSGLFEPSSTVSGSLFLNMKNISLPNEIKIGGFIQ
jgi:hypothetical protein